MPEHPLRLASDHPLVQRVRGLCMRYPEAYDWLAIRVDAASGDRELLEELLNTSYRRVALVRQLRPLDAEPVVPAAE